MNHQCVDDPIGSPNNSADYIRTSTSNKEATFAFPALTVPAAAAVLYVRVTYVAINNDDSGGSGGGGGGGGGGASDIKAALRVGGTTYPSAAQPLSANWATYTRDWTANPQTGSAWTVADVNGSGSNPLQGVGVESGEGAQSVTQIYVTVVYAFYSYP